MTNNFGGTRSYALSPSSARKLLDNSKRWCMPVDNYIGSMYLHNMLHTYLLHLLLKTQRNLALLFNWVKSLEQNGIESQVEKFTHYIKKL